MRVRDVSILVYFCADLLCTEAKAPGSRYADSTGGNARHVERPHDSHKYRQGRSKASDSVIFSEGEYPRNAGASGDPDFKPGMPDCSNGYEDCLPPNKPHSSKKKGGHVSPPELDEELDVEEGDKKSGRRADEKRGKGAKPFNHNGDAADDLHSMGNPAKESLKSVSNNRNTKKRDAANVKASRPTKKRVTEPESDSEEVEVDVGSKTESATDSGLEAEIETEAETEAGTETEEATEAEVEEATETESESRVDSESESEETVDPQLTNTSKSNQETIKVVPEESSAPLGLLEHHCYYPSYIRSKECKRLVDAVIADDLVELNKQLADFVGKDLDVSCIQAVLHAATRNHRQHALWMLTDYFSERLTPPVMAELEPLLLSEAIKSENAYSYWSRLPVPDSVKAGKLKLLLEKLSEPAFIQFVAMWNASKYGSKALGEALSGMSDRRTMLAQLVVRKAVKLEAKCIKTLSTRAIAALINVRQVFAQGSGTTAEDFKVLYGGVKNLEKAIMSDLPSLVDLAMRVEPASTKKFLQQKIIPQAGNLALQSFLRVLAYTDRKDHDRLPTMTLYAEAQFGRELHSKLLGMNKMEDVCNTQKVVDIDTLIPAGLYSGMTTSAKEAFIGHIVMILFDIHPTIQCPVNGTLIAAQEVQQKIDDYCDRPQAAKVKFPKAN